MAGRSPVRRIRNAFELDDLIATLGVDAGLVERDFALMTIAAGLVAEYGDALCFKGGFVLRHVHGHERFSKDIDATRINPPKNKLDAVEVAAAISRAGMKNLMTLAPESPRTDSGRSLDFDRIRYTGPLGTGLVSVEVSYREDVVEQPELVEVGAPYYEPFPIPVMQLEEIVAEKLRAIAQRDRPTDLSDLAMILSASEVDERRVRRLARRAGCRGGGARVPFAADELALEGVPRGGDQHRLGHERDVKRDPNGTLTAGGQHALVQPPDAFLDSYYSARDLQRHPDEPAATLTGVDRHALVQRPGFLARAGGTRRNDVQDSMDPRNTVLPGEDYGVAAPAQQTPEAVEDFGFRMLAPSENQRIQDLHLRLRPVTGGGYEICPLDFVGSNRDRTALAGNGVPRRLMQFHVERCLQALGR